jgi:hypothetical protein
MFDIDAGKEQPAVEANVGWLPISRQLGKPVTFFW